MKNKIIFILYILCLFPSVCYCAPLVTGISSNTISGESFSETFSEPLVYETVLEGEFSDWWESTKQLQVSEGGRTDGYCGNLNFTSTSTYGYFTAKNSEVHRKWFVQYWFKIAEDWDWGDGSYEGSFEYGNLTNRFLCNIKMFRLWNPGAIDENVVFATGGWYNPPSANYATEYMDTSSDETSGWTVSGQGIDTIEKGVWHCWQFEFEESDIDTENGTFRFWDNGNLRINRNGDTKTREDYEQYKRPFIIGWENEWGPNTSLGETDEAPNNFYIDDVYVSSVWSRIEVGNNATFSSCTHREIQIPTAWSDTEISVTWNQGSFANNETCYLFVIDSDGNASSGYEGYFVDGTFVGAGDKYTKLHNMKLKRVRIK